MRLTSIGALIGTLCLAACDNGVNLVAPMQWRGVFILQGSNGSPLPAVIVDSVSPPLRITVLSGSLTLNDDGTFSNEAVLERSLAGVVSTTTRSCIGTFVVVAAAATFTETPTSANCGGVFTGAQRAELLITQTNGVESVYRRGP